MWKAGLVVLVVAVAAAIWMAFGVMMPAQNNGRYQMIKATDNNIYMIDTRTGKCWRKFVRSNEGPTVWLEETPNFDAEPGENVELAVEHSTR